MDEGYTQSEISTWKSCRYKWFLSYVKRLTPKETPTYFEDGGAFHDALEDRGNGYTIAEIGTRIRETYKRYMKELKVPLTKARLESYDKRLAMVLGMFAGYEATYDRTEWEILKCEDEFKVPFQGTFIRGKKDKKVLKQNKVWLVEHKTSSTISSTYVNKLPMDQQTLTYTWADWKETDDLVEGIVYDVIKKPQIRQKKDETRPEFLTRLRDEYIDKPDKYFFRENLRYTKKQLQKFEDNLKKIITLMQKCEDNPKEEVYRNEGACDEYGGCQYKAVCLKKSLKGSHMKEFYQRDRKHQELGEME